LRQRQGYAKSKGMPTSSTADPRLPTPADATNERRTDGRRLPEAAVRALAEAAARRSEDARARDRAKDRAKNRAKNEDAKSQGANEVGGRGGLDPTRYGDWEVNGLASDF
jgi:hypothetical protein